MLLLMKYFIINKVTNMESSKKGKYHKYNECGYDTKLAYAVRPRKRKLVIDNTNQVINYIIYDN